MEKGKKSRVKFFTVLKYYWQIAREYKLLIFINFFLAGIAAVLHGVLSPVVYQNIIDEISTTNFVSFSPAIKNWLLLFVLVAVVDLVANRLTGISANYFQVRIIEKLENFTFSKILLHSRSFFANNMSGSIVAKAGRFTHSFETIFDNLSFNFWSSLVILVGIFFVIFRQDSGLGIVFLAWLIIFSVIIYFFTKKKVPIDSEKAATESKTTGRLADVVTNILSVKVFASFFPELKSFKSFTGNERKIRWKSWFLSDKQITVIDSLMVSLRMLSLYYVINLWSKGQASLGFIVLVQLYTSQIFNLIWNFNFSIRNFGRAVTDAKEMVEIFETPIDIQDPENPEKCKIKDGNILFDNITFEYKDGKDVFKKFKLEIPAGQKVGFVGHSGSGKTTITNLLLRFEDVQSGAIKIDGQDIRNIAQDDLRRNISYVPQEPALFHRTLRENIMYGNPNASKLAVLEASKKAHADEFIKEFKDGYETLVGERGVKLSGGQRQRIAIARVMLKDAPILILDEATSSLDSISENFIQQAFDEVMKDRTTLVIAHRLSTVQKMDRIVVLDKGKIVEDGGHEELLAKGGYYFKLWQAQKDGVI